MYSGISFLMEPRSTRRKTRNIIRSASLYKLTVFMIEEGRSVGMAMNRAEDITEKMKAKAQALDEMIDLGVLTDYTNKGRDTVEREPDKVSTREGHLPDLSDAPYNKILHSKIIGNGVGIGNIPQGGLGRLLVRGEKNWDIIDDLNPILGEYVVDKAGKGAFGQSNLPLVLRNLGITHLVITGITTT